MAQTINTNIMSLNAQRNLSMSQTALATAMQRLSSGLRVNSAKDDAAGLAISERFTTQIRGFNQAIRNANDGISLSQVGEGALGELTSNLQRIRELAVQAANATNSDSDRKALDQEVQQRLQEIDRISSQTTFNGRKLLDGSFADAIFQVGPDAGQTIALSLGANPGTRLSQIGQIASLTSNGLGANATNGSVSIAGASLSTASLDFNNVGNADGSATFDAASRLFGSGTPGSNTFDGTDLIANLSGAGTVAAPATLVTGAITLADNTLSGVDAHFEFSDDTVTGLTVALDGTDWTGNGAGMATEIQNQLIAAGSNTTVVWNTDHLEFTAGETGSGNTLNVANAGAALDTDIDAGTFTDGADFVDNNNVSFTVDDGVNPVNVTLNGNNATIGAVVTALSTALGANYSVSNTGNDITITSANSTNAVAISAFDDNANTFTSLDSTGTAGSGSLGINTASFDVDGVGTVTLDQDYADFDALAADIQSQLETLSAGTYTVTNNNGSISIVNNDGSTPVGITNADANATAAGFINQAAAISSAASFKVDGTTITLNTDPTNDINGLASAVQSALDDANMDYTAEVVDGNLVITNNAPGSDAVVISDVDANAAAVGFTATTGTDGVAAGEIVLAEGDLSIKVGDGDSADFVSIPAGTYKNAQELALAINNSVSGVSAEVFPKGHPNEGEIRLLSTQQIELQVSDAAATALGMSSGVTAASGGDLSLEVTNVQTVQSANETIVRIDAALTAVSDLRSTFGAIQNRFESVISNLSTAAENLTASRSRIVDADFAAETAALSRAQILQQAGTAMVAQANQVPQGVLQLLQG